MFASALVFLGAKKGRRVSTNLAREALDYYFSDRKGNSAILRERYARSRLPDDQAAAIRWLVGQPNGPAKVLVIAEGWSSDCRRDLPYLQRLAEAGGMELRIFNRDGQKILGPRRPDPAAHPDANHDLMLQFMNTKNGGEWASLPVAVFYEGLRGASPIHRVPGHLSQGPGLAVLRPVGLRRDRRDPERAPRASRGGRTHARRRTVRAVPTPGMTTPPGLEDR